MDFTVSTAYRRTKNVQTLNIEYTLIVVSHIIVCLVGNTTTNKISCGLETIFISVETFPVWKILIFEWISCIKLKLRNEDATLSTIKGIQFYFKLEL